MCRLYCFCSTTPQKVECELIRAQNALIHQSFRDRDGRSHPDGWGLGVYTNGRLSIEHQVQPAYQSDAFRWAAARARSTRVIAHIRRATIGALRPENTHPFVHDRWMFAHNGTLAAFEAIRPRLLEAMTRTQRDAMLGETDSEHVFGLLLSDHEREPERPLLDTLRRGLQRVIAWSREEDPAAETALNTLWTDGIELVGSRVGRSLSYVERTAARACEVCGGALHLDSPPDDAYRAVVIASEPVTSNEPWHEVPDGSVFRIDSDVSFHLEPL
jgi:glutamine amidotransferase